jgi:hypothetical protein
VRLAADANVLLSALFGGRAKVILGNAEHSPTSSMKVVSFAAPRGGPVWHKAPSPRSYIAN